MVATIRREPANRCRNSRMREGALWFSGIWPPFGMRYGYISTQPIPPPERAAQASRKMSLDVWEPLV